MARRPGPQAGSTRAGCSVRPTACEHRGQPLHQLREQLAGVSACAPSHSASLRLRVHLDQEPVRAGRRGRQRHRDDQLAHRPSRARGRRGRAGGSAASPAPPTPRSSVLRVAVSNVRMPRSQRMTWVLPAVEQVLGGEQPLLHRRREAPLQQHRPAHLPQRAQEREVLHVPRADLEHVHVVDHQRPAATSPAPRPPPAARGAARASPGWTARARPAPGRRTGWCAA